MKIAICKDYRNIAPDGTVMLKSYRYNWTFKIFGPEYSELISCAYDKATLVKKTKHEIQGKIEVMEILDI